MFFARKKGGRLRAVADCRMSNEAFCGLDAARLAAGDSYGCSETSADDSESLVLLIFS